MLKNINSIAVFALVLSVATPGATAETRPSVSDLLAQVQATYDKMQSYSSAGDVTSNTTIPGFAQQELHSTFSIKLARPDLYRIEWEMPTMMNRGAVWSAGDGNFITTPMQASPTQMKDMSMALGMATGISGGAANTIPSIFFRLNSNSLKRSKDAAFGPDAAIDGDPCYVITKKAGTIRTTMWISEKSKLIRQIRDDSTGPTRMPEMTDNQLSEVLQSMGQKPTAEGIKSMRAMMAAQQAWMNVGATTVRIEAQRQVVVNATLRKADFATKIAPAEKGPPR
ncbi:MAG TPA: hypothetical protein VEC38_01450 [Candidatus Binataceae bacterium]|nr:hypothetical protein [Candidatus Binataceae bacterium]